MQSVGNQSGYKSLLFITALLIASVEIVLPRIPLMPWLKPGLANMVGLVWLYRYGWREALLFGFLRIWVIAFFFGFSFVTFILSVTGMVVSVSLMAFLVWAGRSWVFGTVGISVAGAFAHNIAQLITIQSFTGRLFSPSVQLPVMVPAAVFFGVLSGIGAYHLMAYLEKVDPPEISLSSQPSFADAHGGVVGVTFMLGLSIFFWESMAALFFLQGVLILVLMRLRRLRNTLRALWRSRFILLAVALSFFPFHEPEQYLASLRQTMRLTSWILLTGVLFYFHAEVLFFSILKRWFPSGTETLETAVLMVELFPGILDASLCREKGSSLKDLFRPQRLIAHAGAAGAGLLQGRYNRKGVAKK
ncbi:MAG: Gx transporter family protein [Fibrobacterota bacterium]